MTQLVVVEGYIENKGDDNVHLLLLDGQTIQFKRSDMKRQAPIDTGKEPLMRVFLDPEALISISFRAKDLQSVGASAGGTITKWLDDGGTISKSRDDGFSPASIAKYIDDGNTVRKSLDDI